MRIPGFGSSAPRASEPSAALASLGGGVQARGPWLGRRQLFARFAGESETATLYTGSAFAREVARIAERGHHHALVLGGADALGQGLFLMSAFASAPPPLPVLVETDGQRPDVLAGLGAIVRLVQVAPSQLTGAVVERAIETLSVAASLGCEHALVLEVADGGSDGAILKVVEQAARASAATIVVLHAALVAGQPAAGAVAGRAPLSRRWFELLERAGALHPDVRLLPTL